MRHLVGMYCAFSFFLYILNSVLGITEIFLMCQNVQNQSLMRRQILFLKYRHFQPIYCISLIYDKTLVSNALQALHTLCYVHIISCFWHILKQQYYSLFQKEMYIIIKATYEHVLRKYIESSQSKRKKDVIQMNFKPLSRVTKILYIVELRAILNDKMGE